MHQDHGTLIEDEPAGPTEAPKVQPPAPRWVQTELLDGPLAVEARRAH